MEFSRHGLVPQQIERSVLEQFGITTQSGRRE
jgi:hypothetical protein